MHRFLRGPFKSLYPKIQLMKHGNMSTSNYTTSLPITFWRVEDNRQKLHCVCHVILNNFRNAKRQIIYAPNEQAAQYLDTLLWTYPKGSFIPHTIAMDPVQAAVVITTTSKNLNQAQIVINLGSQIPPFTGPIEEMHDLMDLTSPDKKQLALQREKEYQQHGHRVSVQTP